MDITIYSIEVSEVTMPADNMIRIQAGPNAIRIFLDPERLAELRDLLRLWERPAPVTDEPPSEVLDAVAEREASFAESQS